jgi:hypothetical protein
MDQVHQIMLRICYPLLNPLNNIEIIIKSTYKLKQKMNKKRLNIILIPGTIIIWAIIIMKILSYSKNPPTENYNIPNKQSGKDPISEEDTIKIFANYRNPFSPTFSEMFTQSNTIKPIIKPVQNKISTNVSWPDIIYYGLIKNTKDGKELALLTVSKRTIIAEKNSENEDIRILTIANDSIKVKLHKETKTIIKK